MSPDSNSEQGQSQGLDPETLRFMMEVLNQINQKLDQEIREIRNSRLSQEEQDQKIKELGEQKRAEFLENLQKYQQLQEETTSRSDSGAIDDVNKQNQRKQAEENLQKSLVEATLAAKKGIKVGKTDKAQAVLVSLADKIINESDVANKMANLMPYLLGDKPLVFSSGDQKSDLEKTIEAMKASFPTTARKVVDAFAENAAHFGKESQEIYERFGVNRGNEEMNRSQNLEDQISKQYEFQEGAGLESLFGNLSKEDRKFLTSFINDTEFFINTITEEVNKARDKEQETGDFAKEIKEIYEKIFDRQISDQELRERVKQKIMTHVSEAIAGRLNDIYVQIYKKIFTLGASKPFEEVEREDFMRGIEVLRNHIERGLQRINTEIKDLEKRGDRRLIDLYTFGEEVSTVWEMDINGVMKPVPRLKPMPILKKTSMADFAINLISEFDHWRERTGYSHNSNFIYGQPAHEGSFYKNLSKYAEHIKGVNFDSFMLLPDAPLVQEAYMLYIKFLQEEYAKIDWRMRPDMLSNRLSEFNSIIENDITFYLKLRYGDKFSDNRILNAVKNAVGFFARGTMLTESETNAFADPVDAKGTGFFASYGTNDASPIMALNPLHIIMRWQGQSNYNQVFFMPITGEAGKFFGGWDHNQIYKNIQAYKDMFAQLKVGGEGTTKNLVIDKLLGIAKTGGIFQRRGWRGFYSYESHYVYGGEKGNEIDLLKSYKAMDVIGYEAIRYFLENLNSNFYNTFQLPSAQQKNQLYEFIFNRYFKVINKNADYKSYMDKLREIAKAELKKEKVEITDKSLQKKIDQLFTNRALARIIALRFPTKFLKIDKDRFHIDDPKYQRRRWYRIYELMKGQYTDMTINEFDRYMKDMAFFETMLRTEDSNNVFEAAQMSRDREDFSLGDYEKLMRVLDEGNLKKLIQEKFVEKRSKKDIDRVIALYRLIRQEYLNDSFLDGEAMDAMNKYPFSFGVEDVDMRLIAFRGTGPRMIARSIGDAALMEEQVIGGFLELPEILHKMSIDGKHDFTPVIEYLLKAKKAFTSVHGLDDTYYQFAYGVAGMVVNYFKKDSAAKPLFGLFRLGKLNSMAAEYAGRSSAVWEFDSRDIDRFVVILESHGILLPKPYDKSVGPRYEDRYINIFGKKIKFGKKQIVDFKWNATRFRKEFGGDWKAIAFDYINQFLPIMIAFILWKYIKDAIDEATGKKK